MIGIGKEEVEQVDFVSGKGAPSPRKDRPPPKGEKEGSGGGAAEDARDFEKDENTVWADVSRLESGGSRLLPEGKPPGAKSWKKRQDYRKV